MAKKITQEDKDHYQKLHEVAYNFSFDKVNNEGLDFLIKSYERLIWKFINEVKNEELKYIEDRKIRNLYKLYISKKELGETLTVHKYARSNKVRNLLQKRSKLISNLLTLIEDVDLFQESVIRLMNLAHRYHDEEKPSFHTYVDRVFHFEFYRVIEQNIPKNFNVHNSLTILEYDYNEKYNHNPQAGNDLLEAEQFVSDMNDTENCNDFSAKVFKSLFSDEYFDINWINGITASKLFSCLNFLERKIIKLYYIKGYTDQEVGNELGFSRIVINKRRNDAKDKVAKIAKDECLIQKSNEKVNKM